MIIFISCTKKKQDHPCKAKEMYQASQWFRGGVEVRRKPSPGRDLYPFRKIWPAPAG